MRKFANVFCCVLPPLVPLELELVVGLLLFLLEPHAAASRANPTASATALRSQVRLRFGVTSRTSRIDPLGFARPLGLGGADLTPRGSRGSRFFRRSNAPLVSRSGVRGAAASPGG